jgi:O-acetyl-ADP-ribose deacetylase (regulator of RNase III)
MSIVTIKKQDLFDPSNKVIGHGCNIYGSMSAGIAAVFRKLYPKNFLEYKKVCEEKSYETGDVLVFVENDRTILNIASQDYPGAHAKLEWIKTGLEVIDLLGYEEISLPWIGCGIGGLDRKDVYEILVAANIKQVNICEID